MDLFEARHLVWIGPKLGASDARVFTDTGAAVVAGADAEGDLSELEVAEEFLPFIWGEAAVLLAGALGSATCDEGPVVGDDIVGVDR